MIILPPPGIREIADKTAVFVAKSQNPLQFESKLRYGGLHFPKHIILLMILMTRILMLLDIC